MPRHLRIRPLAGLLLVLFCAVTALAWVQTANTQFGPFFRRVGGSYTFSYEMNLSPSLGKAGSDAALDAARATINNVADSTANAGRGADFDLSEPIDDDVAGGIAIGDGNNRIFFFTTDANNDTDASVLGFAVIGGSLVGNEVQISDCDIAFNEEDFVWNTADPDLESVANHEGTHCYGIGHSSVAGTFDTSGHQTSSFLSGDTTNHATMFPIASGTADDRTYHSDDVAALGTIYPEASFTNNFGTITGTVRNAGGTGVTGAHVVAVAQGAPNTPIVGYLADVDQSSSGTDGFFRLTGLPPGNYFVRVEPLIEWPNFFFQASVFNNSVTLDDTFPPEFWSGGSESDTDAAPDMTDAAVVAVTAGNTTSGINIVTNTVAALNNNTFPGTAIGANSFADFRNISGATTEGSEPAGTCYAAAISRTVWYTFVAPSDGTITFSARGSSYDTAVAAYTGNAVGSLTEEAGACSEDLGNVAIGDHPQSQISFAATNGTTYRFQVSDSNLDSSIGVELGNTLVVNFSFVSANANAPVANDDSYSTGANQQLVVDDGCPGVSGFNDLLCNDTDADLDPLSVVTGTVTSPANGMVMANADGSFTYTPNLGFSGMDTFTYQVTDGVNNSNFATVTITVAQCTRDFDNDGADGQFDNTSNWNPDGVPGSGTNEVLCIGGTFDVTHSVNAETIFALLHTSTQPLTFTGGTLSMDGNSQIGSGGLVLTSGALDMNVGTTLTINGPVTWDAGTMAGSGGSFLLSGGATLSTAGGKTLNGAQVLIPNGQIVTWTDGVINLNNGSLFQNSGTFNAQAITAIDSADSGTFQNSGTFNFAPALDDVLNIAANVFFNNSGGTVNINNGSLNMLANGVSTGPFVLAANRELVFLNPSVFNFDTGGSVSGAGELRVGFMTTVNFNAGSSLTSNVHVGPGTLNLTTGSPITVPQLNFGDVNGGGTINVQTAFTVSGNTLNWLCGTFAGTQTVTIDVTSALSDIGCGDKVLAGGNFINPNGRTMTWNGGTIQFNSATAQLTNSGTFAIQTDADITNGGAGGAIVNQVVGNITKSASAGTTDVGVPFLNDGNLTLNSGTLNFTSGFTQQTNGLTTLSGATLASTGLLTFDGGVLRGNGTVTGNVDINSATLVPGINAPGVLNQTGILNINSSGTFTVDLGGTTPGTGAGFHDQHNVTGTANLAAGSTLNVGLTSFTPMLGDTFLILTATTRIGQFTNLNLPDVSPNSFQVNYLATGVELEVVPNAAPNAVDDNAVTLEDNFVDINVLANDTDSDGPSPLSVSAFTQGAFGAVVTDQGSGILRYTPAMDFAGMDTFTYDVFDGANTVAGVMVTVTVTGVNDAPTYMQPFVGVGGPEDGFSSLNGVTTNMSPGGGADEAGQALNFIVLTDNPGLFAVPPAINATTGELTFTLAQDANGSANLTITLMDNGGTANGGADTSDPATNLLLDVFEGNDAPVAGNDMFTVGENSSNNDLTVLANDDPGPATATDEAGQTLTISNISAPNMGGMAAATNGTISYTPAAAFTGMETFTYDACDNGTTNGMADPLCTTATVTVNVVANLPPVATDDMAATNEDTPVIISVLANDNNGGDGGPLSVTMVTVPANGTAVINMDNTITYTPNADFNGMDTFDYTVSDTFSTDVGTVTVTVTAVNDAPTFTQSCTTVNDVEDVGAVTVPACMQNMSPGPADEAAQALNFVVMNDNPALFSVQPAISATTGDLTFTTAPNANGTANLTVSLMDNGGTANGGDDTSGSVMVQINIAAVNDPPVITAGPTSNPVSPIPGNTAMGASVMFSITATDPDGDTLTFAWSGGCGNSAVEDPTLTCPFGMGLSVDVTVSDPSMATDMGNIVVDVTDYSITAACQGGMPPCNSATMATIARGQAANFNLTAMGINGTYAANITYSCMNLPAQTSCVFTPSASVTSAPPGGVVTMLRIQTTAPGFAQLHAPASPQRSQPPFLAVFLSVPGLALFGLVLAGGRGKRRSLGSLCLLAIVFLMAGVLVGCGSGGDFFTGLGNQGTPLGSHSITINAQGTGTLSHSVNLTVVVQ